MSENDQREQCKEAKFVDENFAKLIQRVTSVMPIVDELRGKGINEEKYEEIKAEKTSQDKVRKLDESLRSGGDEVKKAFYYLLEKHEPDLFKDLSGVSKKRKLADPESPVPHKKFCSNKDILRSQAGTNVSAAAQSGSNITAPVFTENKIGQFIHNAPGKPPATKKVKKTATKKVKKTPATKKVKTPATKKVKKTPATKKVKTPATKKVKKTPAPKKVKKTPATKKVKTPATKKVKKTPAPKKVKKTPATKKVKTPAPKKAKTVARK